MDKGKAGDRECKQESMAEEVKEHRQLWKNPRFRTAVERGKKGAGERKGMGKR